MFNNELVTVGVLSFVQGVDEYGQRRQLGSTSRSAEMYVKTYQQTATADIRYNDVTLIGLTKDRLINDTNEIKIGTESYIVLYVIPSRRYNQVLLKKK